MHCSNVNIIYADFNVDQERNTHAPYCHLCPAPLYNTFLHYLINSAIFGNVTGHKCYLAQNVCLDFLYNICLKHFSL
jgi:hypothetical protein